MQTSQIVRLGRYGGGDEVMLEVLGQEAKLASVGESSDAASVLGFTSEIELSSGSLLLAYWADQRKSAANAPDYAGGLNVLVGTRVYRPFEDGSRFSISIGIRNRQFCVSRASSTDYYKYYWPIWREFLSKTFGDPFLFDTKDFADFLCGLVAFYTSRAARSSEAHGA